MMAKLWKCKKSIAHTLYRAKSMWNSVRLVRGIEWSGAVVMISARKVSMSRFGSSEGFVIEVVGTGWRTGTILDGEIQLERRCTSIKPVLSAMGDAR
jgi:hypothetical protein